MKPLSGIRVLELTHYLAGPYCTLFLADLGAEVIKIESPEHPDLGRNMPGCRVEGETGFFHTLNRGKKSVALDLKQERPRAVFHRLAETADVVVDNYRVGVTERLGADPGTLSAINPQIVTCSISGFGATGPRRDLPSYDYLVQAMSGTMSITGDPDGKPTKYGVSIVDHATGILGAFAIVTALRAAERDGTGQHIDLALFDAHVHVLSYLAADYLNCGAEPQRYADSAHPYIVPSQRFSTEDGDVVVMPMTDTMWQTTCQALGLDELGRDEELKTAPGRLRHRARVIEALETELARRSTAETVELLTNVGVPVAPVNSVPDALADPQTEARGMIVEGDGVRMLGTPVKLSAVAEGPYRRAPHMGEHTTEVLRELGVDGAEIESLWPTT